ncbi:malate dehydrogenase (oxaloacetate-decarboxylating) [Maledivibacter halophilus]|uniref:Malate dehydrogenase (Oxaloacetate-decarboxylating) n=1 Tax=Maledivibacter halophilus TaxID=36842 RepID=A0A1T5ME74_9FIRM|nr:malic enzyme-like NAD(P)-binding protein [Maledivibacter halophilus]SKC86507.1 malate dehydrogenase (oxaloacetate-decarboxylating) [Maledivibacter halophilus]
MDIKEKSLLLHKTNRGKLKVESRVPLENGEDLSLAYTPGVAEPCKEINKDKNLVYEYTSKGNFVAVVSDGTAVLGLGNIGAEAALPVMEGKSILFKGFGGVDAFPICLGTTDVDDIVRTVKLLEPSFGGINLEDIGAPACFEIEKRLKECMNIPVFHDDQHGTAIVALAGLLNALKLVNKRIEDVKIIINGAGAAATAVAKLIISNGGENIIVCDRKGAIYKGKYGMDNPKEELANMTNKENIDGELKEVIKGADIFIGLSAANVMTSEMVKTMANKPIIFAMANPVPEIMPDEAKKGGVAIMATGRSDFPNQINNVLAFPGIFRGALDIRATDINEEMKIAAAKAIANIIEEDELNPEYIIPDPFDKRVALKVAVAVAKAAMDSGVAQINLDINEYQQQVENLVL